MNSDPNKPQSDPSPPNENPNETPPKPPQETATNPVHVPGKSAETEGEHVDPGTLGDSAPPKPLH